MSKVLALPVDVWKLKKTGCLLFLSDFLGGGRGGCGFRFRLDEAGKSALDDFWWKLVSGQDGFEPFELKAPVVLVATNSPNSLC